MEYERASMFAHHSGSHFQISDNSLHSIDSGASQCFTIKIQRDGATCAEAHLQSRRECTTTTTYGDSNRVGCRISLSH